MLLLPKGAVCENNFGKRVLIPLSLDQGMFSCLCSCDVHLLGETAIFCALVVWTGACGVKHKTGYSNMDASRAWFVMSQPA